MEILNAIGDDGTMLEPLFIEMSSLSRRYIYCKGVFPIFALPAVHSLILKPLFKKLHYPVFSATTTSMDSMKEIADGLYSVCTSTLRNTFQFTFTLFIFRIFIPSALVTQQYSTNRSDYHDQRNMDPTVSVGTEVLRATRRPSISNMCTGRLS